MIIYEFELNGRNEYFFEDLKQVIMSLFFLINLLFIFIYIFKLFEIIEVLEIRKGKFNPNIKQ